MTQDIDKKREIIENEIISDARKKAEKIIKNAKKEEEKILKSMEIEINNIREEHNKKLIADSEAEKSKIVSTIDTEVKKIRLAKISETLDAIIKEAVKEFLKSERVLEFVKRVIGSLEDDFGDIYISCNDLYETLNTLGIECKRDEAIKDGFIIFSKNGNKMLDFTIDGIIQNYIEDIRLDVYDLIKEMVYD